VTAVTDRRRGAAQHADIATLESDPTMFKTNVGGIDRIVRILAGLALLGLTLTGAIGAWGWIGLVPLATGLMGSCPAYRLIGLDTCPMKSRN
jgi:hypothetical protein